MYYFYFFQKNTHTPNLEFSSENNQKKSEQLAQCYKSKTEKATRC